MGKGHEQAIHKRNRNGQHILENMLNLTSNKIKTISFFNALDKQRFKRLLMPIVIKGVGIQSLPILMMEI